MTRHASETIEQAIDTLRRHPDRPVVTQVGDLTVELRAVPATTAQSAAEVFAALGPWEGETTAELQGLLADARRHGGSRPVTGP